ncbi:MAG: Gfo/Idh/MocA family oxidoreductase [Candidatus Marinimicrobia bacterium]|nr:Gfo/Idh/MocA family oxidoreductase [Candidatus Neomarinimicrobiota bacterium]
MQDIRWGIIGCGNVCEIKSGPGFQQAEGSQLVAVMRRDGDLAADFASRHGVGRWYNNAGDLINDPTVNAIYIATPPRYHLEYTLMTAAAGKPAYVEKPMGMNYAECVELIEIFNQHKLPLFVAYYRRALPRFLKIKQLLDEGRIGTIRYVNTVYQCPPKPEDTLKPVPWRLDPEKSPGGYFGDLAPHAIDILQFFFGEIIKANGQAVNLAGLYPAVDLVSGSYSFESGVLGTGVWCFTAATKLDRTEVIGTQGSLVFSIFGNDPVILTRKSRTEILDLPNPATIQGPLIQTIVDQLRGSGKCPSTSESAARTNWVMDQLLGN